MNSDEDTARPVTTRVYRPHFAAGRPVAWEVTDEDLDEIEDEFDVRVWIGDFREGSSEIDLCGGCGRPTGVYLALGEWAEHPLICGYCLIERP